MSPPVGDTPGARAEQLLQRVLGEARYQLLLRQGYLDLPSRLRKGRVYRIDTAGNLSYREPGQGSFATTLCIQPSELLPRADLVALRYLMVTADEAGLLATANPIRFSLVSIATAVFRDARDRYGTFAAWLYTAGVLGLFLGALVLEAIAMIGWFGAWPVFGLMLAVMAAPAAILGGVLALAGLCDLWMATAAWICRRFLPDEPAPARNEAVPGGAIAPGDGLSGPVEGSADLRSS